MDESQTPMRRCQVGLSGLDAQLLRISMQRIKKKKVLRSKTTSFTLHESNHSVKSTNEGVEYLPLLNLEDG